MAAFKFDKEKYLAIAKQEGIGKALTVLQNDVTSWEYQAFEGEKGWQPEMWEELKKIRVFSRELWDASVTPHPALVKK